MQDLTSIGSKLVDVVFIFCCMACVITAAVKVVEWFAR